jgi:hypothetical protein
MKTFGNATFDELCAFRSDHGNVGDWSIMTDTTVVWISDQAVGHEVRQSIEIPRSVFNRLVKAYLKPRRPIRNMRST